jgi:hypothetical protein
LTDVASELTEDEKQLLNEKLFIIREHLEQRPRITVTFFVEDTKKDGGAYITLCDCVKRLDEFERILYMSEGDRIPLDDIRKLEGKLFGTMDIDG